MACICTSIDEMVINEQLIIFQFWLITYTMNHQLLTERSIHGILSKDYLQIHGHKPYIKEGRCVFHWKLGTGGLLEFQRPIIDEQNMFLRWNVIHQRLKKNYEFTHGMLLLWLQNQKKKKSTMVSEAHQIGSQALQLLW